MHRYVLLIIFYFSLSCCIGEYPLLNWAENALKWLQMNPCPKLHNGNIHYNIKNCSPVGLFCPILETKYKFDLLEKSNIRVYVAPPTKQGKLKAISADGGTKHSGLHDAVLVLDMYPNLRFGHPVFIFFIDLHIDKDKCNGMVLGVTAVVYCTDYAIRRNAYLEFLIKKNGECLQYFICRRCHRNFRHWHSYSCHTLFLPEVYLDTGIKNFHFLKNEDRLECRNINGFHQKCPKIRNFKNIGNVDKPCDPLTTNSKSCESSNFLKTNCAFMQTCDHAVLLSGGWNKQLADEESFKNIVNMNNLLLTNGFLQANIKTFFANGLNKDDINRYYTTDNEVYSAGLKLALRYHIRTLCENPKCVDTLFIYMNSPTRPDGAMLLWDVSKNGEYDETEIYSAKEFVRDIQNCSAKRVLVLSDQMHTEELIRLSSVHLQGMKNLAFITAKNEHVKDFATKEFLLKDHLSSCLSDWTHSNNSNLQFASNKANMQLFNVTLAGAPCDNDLLLDLNQDEIKRKYFGCQNLSTLEMLEP